MFEIPTSFKKEYYLVGKLKISRNKIIFKKLFSNMNENGIFATKKPSNIFFYSIVIIIINMTQIFWDSEK